MFRVWQVSRSDKVLAKAYLAGPEVFLPNAQDIGEEKKRICRDNKILGLFPLDVDIGAEANIESDIRDFSRKIYLSNIELITECDIIIANMTPFRGPSMDVGTAFEVGYGVALGKPVFGYSFDARQYLDRVISFYEKFGLKVDRHSATDPFDRVIEKFGLPENLMLSEAVKELIPLSIQHVKCDKFEPIIHDAERFKNVVDKITKLDMTHHQQV